MLFLLGLMSAMSRRKWLLFRKSDLWSESKHKCMFLSCGKTKETEIRRNTETGEKLYLFVIISDVSIAEQEKTYKRITLSRGRKTNKVDMMFQTELRFVNRVILKRTEGIGEMAERRMFAKTIIDSDAFLDMPMSAQLLYFHLSMRADDDGFINKPKSIMRMCGSKDDDIKLLFAKKFLIPFESGVVVIKHWKIHNYIRKDTYTETKYKEEKNLLEFDENNAYRLTETCPLQVRDESVTSPSTQVRIGKDRIDKDSLIESDAVASKPAKPVKHKYGEYKNVLLTDDELSKLKDEYPDYAERIERLSSYVASKGVSYKSHYATIRNWARKDATQKRSAPKASSNDDFMAQLKSMYVTEG